MQLKVKNKLIIAPIDVILKQIRTELGDGRLRNILDDKKGRNVICTCPSHKDGFERNPSMSVFSDINDPDVEYGKCHCFTCGYTASLPQMIADVFNESLDFGEEWLIERFGDVFVQELEYLPPIELNKQLITPDILAEESLIQFDYYHPYMWYRKLSKEIVDKYRVGYDQNRQAITFPVYDEKHRLVMVTARSVLSKMFYIPEDTEKPVYLLFDALENNANTLFLMESQINCLYFKSLFPHLYVGGLFGTGSKTQLDTLKKCGIRNYVLLFDGDSAGRKGAARFKNVLGNNVFITDIQVPWGKDINDLSKEEILTLFTNNGINLENS